MPATLSDMQMFDDNRAGACTVIDGAAEYLTFALQDCE